MSTFHGSINTLLRVSWPSLFQGVMALRCQGFQGLHGLSRLLLLIHPKPLPDSMVSSQALPGILLDSRLFSCTNCLLDTRGDH